MQFLTNTKIDFMKYRKVFIWVSILLLVVGAGELAVDGLNLGIDFAGGTQTTIRLREAKDIDTLRDELSATGLEGVAVQRFGEVEDRELLVKVPVDSGEASEAEDGEESERGPDSATRVLAALDQVLNAGNETFDMNRSGSDALALHLFESDPDGRLAVTDSLDAEGEAREYYDALATKVLQARNTTGIFSSWDEVGAVDGITDTTMTLLQADANLGGYSILSNETVGPQIGGELRQKGVLAVVFSLLGMLAYIWYRFELRFGIGALVAVFHDFLIVLGIYAIMKLEFNLSSIAAFLTLVGYSVNDTVVIFDRVRENMRKARRMPLVDVMNLSINQTLARTVMTSGTTLIAVTCLYVIGGGVIRDFAFILLIGIVIGTYSSVFIASPFALLWEQWFGEKNRKKMAKVNTQTV